MEKCNEEKCSAKKHDSEKELERIICKNPGCLKSFHVKCIGWQSKNPKECKDAYFVCNDCIKFLSYAAAADFTSKSVKQEFIQIVNDSIDKMRTDVQCSIDATFTSFKKEFEKQIESMEIFQDIEKNMNELRVQIDEQGEKIKENEKDNAKLKEILTEHHRVFMNVDREKRKFDLIVSGVPELPIENMVNDREKITYIFKLVCGSTFENAIIRRIGKKSRDDNDEARMILVTFENLEDKFKVLNNASKLNMEDKIWKIIV
ncbi:Uncharacterised protein r2_g3391 [Pycnogonum litorale]